MSMHTGRLPTKWQDRPFLPALPQANSLNIYDLRTLPSTSLLSISSLVGLVNRGSAKVYLVQNDDDEFWLREVDPALPRVNVAVPDGDPLASLLTAYREQLKGLVIYDPRLPATINVATTLASLREGLVVSPAQAEALQAEPYRLPLLADLRNYAWQTSVQAYAWAYEHLLPECSTALVAGLHPEICGSLRPLLVTHRVFTCWLDARKFWPDTWQNWLSERCLLKRILARFPPGATHLGWFISEPFGIRLTSPAALLTLASDHSTNLEVWSTLPAPSAPTTTSEPEATPAPQADTTYLSFTISDGDNLQYCQHRMLHMWQSPVRGTLPLGWTITPALGQTMPALAAFYRRTASVHDEFIAGPSGVAYMLPSHWPQAYRQDFLRLTAEAMREMQLSLLQVLDSGTWFSMKFLSAGLQKLFVKQLGASGLRGIFSGSGNGSPSWQMCEQVPIYQNLGLALDAARAQRLIEQAARSGARFINIYIFAWKIAPEDLATIVKQLGPSFTVVTPGHLLHLITQQKR